MRIVLLLALVACNRRGDGDLGRLPDARVTFTSEGAGPENDAPLEPARTGFATARADAWQRWTGAIDAGRDEVLAKEISGGNQPLAPSIGQGVGLYRQTRDGLVVHALDAPLDDEILPVLMVPDTVRVGMAWESEYGDGENVNRMEVVRHQTVMLPSGPADAWAIAEYTTSGGTEYVSLTRWYAEGIGRIGTGIGEGIEWSPEWGYTELVFPHDEQAHEEPPLARVPLIGAVPIEPHGNNGHEIWGLSGAVIDGVLYGYMDGSDPAIGYTPTTSHDYCARLGGAPQWVAHGDPGCPTHVIQVPNPDYPSAYTEATVLIDNAAVLLPGVDLTLDLDPTGAAWDITLTGWITGDVAYTLESDVWGAGPAQYRVREHGTEGTLPRLVTDAITHRDAYIAGRARWIGPARVAAGATTHFAILGQDGRVFRASMDGERVYGLRPVGVLPGAASIVLDGDERLVYSITTDGRVYRLTVDQGTGDVAIDALGAVRVEEPGGAYEFKGAIADPANPTDLWVAAIATSATSVPAYQTGIFLAHLEGEAVPLVSAPSLSVAAADTIGGVLVCWEPSDEPFDASGWTYRGEPVWVEGPVGPEGNCAIVAADVEFAAPSEWAGAERAIAGTVPGVGRVDLGFPPGKYAGPGLFGSAAVLRDGRVIDVKGVELDRDGFPTQSRFTDITSNSRGWPHDLGGYGLWTWPGTNTPTTEIRNIGGGIPNPACPSDAVFENCYYAGVVVGGGILMASPPPLPTLPPPLVQVVRPDGTIEDLPAAQTKVRWVGILLEDGRLCGFAGGGIACTDALGVSTTTGPLPGLVGASNDQWWPLSDGSLLVCNRAEYGPAMRFDPVAMTVTAIDDRGLTSPMSATDGRVYAVAPGGDGFENTLVEVTPAGVVDVADIGANDVVLPIDGAFLVGPNWTRLQRP